MNKIEKKMWLAAAVVFVLFLGSCGYIASQLDNEFGDCKGLQGLVDSVWTGERCVENQP